MEALELETHLSSIRAAIMSIPGSNESISNENIAISIDAYESMQNGLGNELIFSPENRDYIIWKIGNFFNVNMSDVSTSISSKDVDRWFDAKKTEFDWNYWKAYYELLIDQGRAKDVIEKNEQVINNILDLSGDPRKSGRWARKGLVMGNVQSGKTQNYIGLVNKAIDCGYKIIILLGGGNSNDLRKQTQARVDEGVIGASSDDFILGNAQQRVGVGKFRDREFSVATMTSTSDDFKKTTATTLRISLDDLKSPIIFTLKKNTNIMQNLYDWLKDFHSLNPEENIRLDYPMMLIDDEADYATPNTRKEFQDATRTNSLIRQTIDLFNKSTYIGYTATPFANIFIHPETYDEGSLKDDLFPENFMIRVPTPDSYLGQNFYFENQDLEKIGPIKIIDDNEEMYPMTGQKTHMVMGPMSQSLKESINAFVIACAIRDSRGQEKEHKSMIINITHLNALQGQITNAVTEYLNELKTAITHLDGLDISDAKENSIFQRIIKTFNSDFEVPETIEVVLEHANKSINKIQIFGVNASTNLSVDYSEYKKNGLSAIIVGGYKLSRGLTLEGLSTSYFARNSKAYDTLMQMCRWFGYRFNYEDLCKVYLPAESNEWYVHISEAISDLYAELRIMEKNNKTPKDFGLRVRDHPGALTVTARNRMQSAANSVINIDLWGQIRRRFKFHAEKKESHEVNLKATEKFITKIKTGSNEKIIEPSGSILLENVEHDDVLDYLREVDLIEDEIGDLALHNHIKKMSTKGMNRFKVLIKNVSTSRNLTWENDPRFKEKKLLKYYDLCGYRLKLAKRNLKLNEERAELFFPSASMGSGTDEGLFISSDERKRVTEEHPTGKPSAHQLIVSEERNFPGLIIYLFAAAEITPYEPATSSKIEEVKIVSDKPIVGLSVSFPLLENYKNLTANEIRHLANETKVQYQTNYVWQQMELFHQSEEE